MLRKDAIFFTLDSLLAAGIVITTIIVISTFYSVERESTSINYASQDIMKIFSTMTVGEVNNAYVKNLTSSGIITNTNNTIIEQIGEFWAENNVGIAKNFTKNLTEDIIPPNYGFSVLVDGEEIYSRNIPLKGPLVSSRKMVSGIAKAKPTEGFTARVLLTGIKSKKTNAYVYFGGYEGDGNLTKKLILPVDVISFNSSYLEVETGGDFNLYINNIFSGNYAKGSGGGGNMLADKWNISNSYLQNFKAGENNISINFTSGSSFIAGGFLRLTYTTSSYNDTQVQGYERYNFPGIAGVINLYSSIYAQNTPTNMNASLHFLSQYQIYLNIGNKTVFESTPSQNEQIVFLNNSNFSSVLNYAQLSQKTVPLRLGLRSANITVAGKISDSVLITDRTSSMSACDVGINCIAGLCDSNPTGGCHDRRDNVAIRADKKFVDTVLKTNGSKVALVGFGTDAAPVCDFHDFSDDNVSLKYRISNYSNEWCHYTCISCGIQAATELLTENEVIYGLNEKSAINTTQFHVGDSGSGVSVNIKFSISANKSKFVKSRLTIFGRGVDTENDYHDCIYFNGIYIGRMCEPHGDPGWHTCSYSIKSEWLNSPNELGPSNGLVGHWPFDEGSGTIANDASGNGLNGTLVNDPSWINGQINKALDFDGNNDLVSIPYSSSLNVKKMTVAAWVYKDANAPNWANVIARQYGTSWSDVFNLVYANTANDEYSFIIRTAGDQVMLTGPSSTGDLNTWVHFAATYNGSNMTIYKNGVQIASTLSQSGDMVSETKRITIGSQDNDAAGNPAELLPGIIDDVRFYNRSLSQSEIMELYKSTSQNQVTITGGTTSGCFQTTGDNDDWDFKDVKLTVWESKTSILSLSYNDTNKSEIQIGDSPLQQRSSLLLALNTSKSKIKSANLEFEALDVNPLYYDCIYVNGNYIGSVDNQEWNLTNVWQKIYFDVPVAWLKDGQNEINFTSGTTSGCHRTSGDNDEWRFRNVNFSARWLDESIGYDRTKAMLVMSDGEANTKIGDCAGCDSTGARNETVRKACEAKSLYGISVYTVLFGDVTSSNARKTLNQSACCDDCSHFYIANNSDDLIEIYTKIAQSVGNITFQAQSVNLSSGNLLRTVLYPDSYLSFNYSVPEVQFNKVPLGFETNRFGNNISSGTLTIYPNTSVLDAKVTSYSGNKWTDYLSVNGNAVYRLSDYNSDYQNLGDPYIVNIPTGNINIGSNSITISTGANSTSPSSGSNDSRVIYILLLNGFADYSSVVAKSDGCSWVVAFEDGSASTIKVPQTYNGADLCSFASKTYDSADALDNAVYQLFSNLDLDKDGKLEVNIDENNLNINTLTVSKVPSLWGPAIIEVRVWE